MAKTGDTAKVAHKVPGRLRIKLPKGLGYDQRQALVKDLKNAPGVSDVRLSNNSLIIQHGRQHGEAVLEHVGNLLPDMPKSLDRLNTAFDEQTAKLAQRPLVNKGLPLVFLGIAAYIWRRGGNVLAGETVFGVAYLAFDLYWKFQQENVMAKIQQGLSGKEKQDVEQKAGGG